MITISYEEPLYDIELETGIIIHSLFRTVKRWEERVSPFYERV